MAKRGKYIEKGICYGKEVGKPYSKSFFLVTIRNHEPSFYPLLPALQKGADENLSYTTIGNGFNFAGSCFLYGTIEFYSEPISKLPIRIVDDGSQVVPPLILQTGK